ncbi:hypothetical protein J6590_047452 [Homalodisca vitripennis]|nr:hypothetical protein J6590_047452 [Homalodisca vitripennis]
MFRALTITLTLMTGWGGHASHDCSHMGSLLTYYINGVNGPCWPGFLPFIVIPELPEGSLSDTFSEDRYISGDEVATYIETGGAYSPKGERIGDLGPERLLLVETIHIDLTSKAAKNPNYEVQVEDIEEWICNNGPIPPRAFIIFNTGWSFKRGTRYYGPDTVLDLDQLSDALQFDISSLPFLVPGVLEFAWPGISAEAAEFLLNCFFIVGIGIDTPSVDAGYRHKPYSSDIPDSRAIRRYLSTYGMYLVHNILLLDIHLPARGIFSTLGVFNMRRATRAPVNIYVEYCIKRKPSTSCELADYCNVVFGNYPYRRV